MERGYLTTNTARMDYPTFRTQGLPIGSGAVDVAETRPAEGGALLISRLAVPQSTVTFGQGGLKRDDPDWYAARLLNDIIGGGGFRGRLMKEIREKRGLAYGVSTGLVTFRHAALILGNVATENARVAQSIDLIRSEWRRMRGEGPTEAELDEAKGYLIGSFPLSLDSSEKIASLLVEIQLPYGSAIEQTSGASKKVEDWLAKQTEAKIVTAYIGQGAPRFFLAMSPELPDPSFAKIVVLPEPRF